MATQKGDGEGFPRPDLMDADSMEFGELETVPDEDAVVEGEQGDTSATPGATEDESGGDEPVVLTADGKHTIPFEVFKGLRDSEAAARRQAEEAAARAKELEDKLNALQANGAGRDGEAAGDDLEAMAKDIAELKEEFPALGGPIEAMSKTLARIQNQLKNASERLNDHDRREQDERARTEEAVRQEVAKAIDSNPVLVHWSTSDPEAWGRAKAMDTTLKSLPEWAGKPYSERFEAVVKAVQAIYPQATMPKKVASQEEIERRAREAVGQAGESGVDSLSDIPGGRSPGARADTSKLSPMQLYGHLGDLDDERMSEWLAKNV